MKLPYQDNSPPPSTTAHGQLPPANSSGTLAPQDNSLPEKLPPGQLPPKGKLPPRL